ncbi:MAG: YitT family protein [Peptococcaceae bacterium]
MLWQKFTDTFFILLGSLLYGFGINYFIVANHLAEGGFTGIALILHYTFGWPIGTTILIGNIPLLIVSWRIWGWEFVSKTILGVVSVSLFIDLTAGYKLIVNDLLLAALYGGVITGAGLGLVLRYGGTTGGADIIGRLVNHFWGVRMGKFYLVFDFLVISTIALFFGLTIALYSLVTIFVFSKVTDYLIEGLDSANQALIISDHSTEIAQKIDQELGRGFTYLQGRGGFRGIDTQIILCVVGKWQIFRLKRLVKEIDPKAFVIVSDVYEALGEGFKEGER